MQVISSSLPQNKSTCANNVFCIPVVICSVSVFKSFTSPRSLSTAACGQSSTCRRARPPAHCCAQPPLHKYLLEVEKDNDQLEEKGKDNLFKHVLKKVLLHLLRCTSYILVVIFFKKNLFREKPTPALSLSSVSQNWGWSQGKG